MSVMLTDGKFYPSIDAALKNAGPYDSVLVFPDEAAKMKKVQVDLSRGLEGVLKSGRSLADNEVVLEFVDGAGAAAFESWWRKVGEFLFGNWCDRNY